MACQVVFRCCPKLLNAMFSRWRRFSGSRLRAFIPPIIPPIISFVEISHRYCSFLLCLLSSPFLLLFLECPCSSFHPSPRRLRSRRCCAFTLRFLACVPRPVVLRGWGRTLLPAAVQLLIQGMTWTFSICFTELKKKSFKSLPYFPPSSILHIFSSTHFLPLKNVHGGVQPHFTAYCLCCLGTHCWRRTLLCCR